MDRHVDTAAGGKAQTEQACHLVGTVRPRGDTAQAVGRSRRQNPAERFPEGRAAPGAKKGIGICRLADDAPVAVDGHERGEALDRARPGDPQPVAVVGRGLRQLS